VYILSIFNIYNSYFFKFSYGPALCSTCCVKFVDCILVIFCAFNFMSFYVLKEYISAFINNLTFYDYFLVSAGYGVIVYCTVSGGTDSSCSYSDSKWCICEIESVAEVPICSASDVFFKPKMHQD